MKGKLSTIKYLKSSFVNIVVKMIKNRMKYIVLPLICYLLASCSGEKVHPKPPTSIDWKEELFGVGLLGESLDSLNYVWFSFDVHPNSIGQIEGHPDFRFRLPYTIDGDTIKLDNHRVLYYHFNSLEDWRVKKEVFEDTSSFIISRKDSLSFQLDKLSGHDLVPKQLFIQLSPQTVNPKFLHADIRTGFASSPSNFKLSTYYDTTFLIMDSWKFDDIQSERMVELNEVDQRYIFSYINTLIKKRDEGKATDVICTLGYMYDIELAYDSLMYKYDNLSEFKIVPDYLHLYFENTIDTSRLIPIPEEDFYQEHLYIKERYRDYINFPKGNDIIHKATVQEVPSGPPEEPIIIEDE